MIPRLPRRGILSQGPRPVVGQIVVDFSVERGRQLLHEIPKVADECISEFSRWLRTLRVELSGARRDSYVQRENQHEFRYTAALETPYGRIRARIVLHLDYVAHITGSSLWWSGVVLGPWDTQGDVKVYCTN